MTDVSMELRDRLIEALMDGGDFTAALAESYADYLIPLVVGHARIEVRRFYLDAAEEAAKLGRRGPNAVADWLLDFGRNRADEMMVAVRALYAPSGDAQGGRAHGDGTAAQGGAETNSGGQG